MDQTFADLGVSAPLAEALHKMGMATPTDIQVQVIPAALAGRDIIGQSPTGTGKTLAYLLPVLQKIDGAVRGAQALILAPTHELAVQIQRQIELTVSHAGLAVTSALIIGNVNITRQIEKLKEKPHIIVGSGGRILELIQKKKITAQTVKTIVLDEADRLLDDKNLDSVKAVIRTTLKDRQLLLFSATITAAALARAKEFMTAPEVITVNGQGAAAPDIAHLFFIAEQRDKIEVLRKLARSIHPGRALVFINKSHDIETTVAKLNYLGLKAAGIHGSFVKTDRQKSLEDFRSGRVQLLVASDVAARGLDIPGVDYVINLDMPEDPQLYLHRAGRTGRAGQSGTALSIVTRRESALTGQLAKTLDIRMVPKRIVQGRIADVYKK